MCATTAKLISLVTSAPTRAMSWSNFQLQARTTITETQNKVTGVWLELLCLHDVMRYSACLRRETFIRHCQRNGYWYKCMTRMTWKNLHYIWHHASPLFHSKQFQGTRSLESDLGMDIWSAHTCLWHAITLHALTSITVCKVQVSGWVITFISLCWYCSKC